MRRAKIVCTLGPATSSPARVRELVLAGMDIARLNLSHGEYSAHEKVYRAVRQASDETGRAVGILVDLQGPKIRTGRFADGPVTLKVGERFTITTQDVAGDRTRVSTTYKGMPGDVTPGDLLLIDDGKVTLRAVAVSDTDIDTEVIEDVHAIMDEVGVRLPVIAKIEKPQAVENLPEILEVFDGLMVARGDLGVELPLEQVPLVQKRAVELARNRAKPVIVATQVLESMIENSRPTRAEASDAANAILDGADAVMLSGETSVGAWPIDAVRTMARIIENTEEHGLERLAALKGQPRTIGGAVTLAAFEVGELINAKYLVTFTSTGDSAKRLARFRSKIPMLAFTSSPSTRSQLALVWGIETYLGPSVEHTDQMAEQVEQSLLAEGRCVEGDLIVMVAGSPPGIPGSTNMMRVLRVAGDTGHANPYFHSHTTTDPVRSVQ